MLSQTQNPQLPRGSIGFALGIAGIVFCLILDYGKVALATEALFAMASFRLLSAVCYALIVICLYGLSMLAATFMLTSHTTSAIAEQSDKQIATLQQAITDKQTQLNACSAGMMTKCINPRTQELNALQTQLNAVQAGISKEVIEAKDRAATWEKLANAVGSTSEELQVKLAFTRAVLLEIIAPIFVSLFLSRYRNGKTTQELERLIQSETVLNSETPPPIAQQSAQPTQFKPIQYSGLKW